MENYWLDTNEYPFSSKFFDINGVRLHYIDEGQGPILLFVHGTPSWSFDFRHIIKKLSSHFRCVAIDHIGFGLSDKPERYDYATRMHSATLEQFIVTQKLQNITLVVHDFGGPIGLHVAMRHPALFSRFIIFNSWLWSSQNDPEFIKMSKILKSPLLPFLYRYLNFSPRFILPRSFGEHQLPAQTLRQYTQPFGKPSQRNGALAFAKSLLNDQDWFGELWSRKANIAAKPTLLIWGMKDPVIKPYQLDKFLSGFPNAQVLRLETCGHFPQEEQPQQVVEAMKKFLS
ncbi:MAG: alpha/beta fold hydrolase [Spirosomaceae bacterium]|jgi:pimeloyl-ACP methyl ester carboxylesterase|nr:alpha/beta fold hydrolase [Spirosomataceae bacterium]